MADAADADKGQQIVAIDMESPQGEAVPLLRMDSKPDDEAAKSSKQSLKSSQPDLPNDGAGGTGEEKYKLSDSTKSAAQIAREKSESEKALAKEEARSMLDDDDNEDEALLSKIKEKAKQKGRTRKETVQSTKSFTPSLGTLRERVVPELDVCTERPSEKNMEDLLNDEEKAEILAVSKSQELPVATSPLEPLTKTDEKALSHEDIPQSIPDLSQQVGTRSGTQSTISHTSNASLGPLFCPDPEVSRERDIPSQLPLSNGKSKPHAKPGSLEPAYGETTSEFSEAEFDTDAAMKQRELAKQMAMRRLRTSSQCDALKPVPHEHKKNKWQEFFHRRRHGHHRHEMFVRLDELCQGPTGDVRWQEKARWIKFEEDVEEAAHRWGKPHLASISFRSVVDLRKCIKKGAILLDIDEEDLPSIAQRVVEQLVFIDQLEPEYKKKVLKILLQKHRIYSDDDVDDVARHTDDKKPFSGIRKRTISIRSGSIKNPMSSGSQRSLRSPSRSKSPPDRQFSNMSAMSEISSNAPGSPLGVPDVAFFRRQDHVHIDVDDMTLKANSAEELNTSQNNNKDGLESSLTDNVMDDGGTDVHFNAMLAKILKGAEATSVMVGMLDFIDHPVTAFVRLSKGREIHGLTEVGLPIKFMFILLVPPGYMMDHYEVGRAISALMANPCFRDAMYDAEGRTDILDAVLDYLDDSIVLPPGDWDKKTLLPIIKMAKKHKKDKAKIAEAEKDELDLTAAKVVPDDPLKRTKRPFGGLVNDVKRRYAVYLSDIKDGLNIQCFATILFIYFAALSPAITFGGLLTEKAGRWLGVTEMMLGNSVCGLIFALFSGQPLLIVGATGPLLVFEEALYQICGLLDLDFISLRVWVGIWVTVITILTVALEGSFLIHYFTRFIHEVFASLISLILILETLKKLVMVFVYHPLKEFYPPPGFPENVSMCLDVTTMSPIMNMSMRDADYSLANASVIEDHHPHKVTGQPNTALLSLILCFGTFFIAYTLRSLKSSKLLGKRARRVIGDFAVPIAIFIMVLLDYFLKDTYTEKLDVPGGLVPTDASKRGWFISPLGSSEKALPVWGMFFAIVPSMLVYILIFMETELTTMILGQKERMCKKGCGYHLDLLLVGSFATLCGFLGLPFLCPATLRSLTHMSALGVYSSGHAPGEKPHLIKVREQRITAFGIHIVLGLSILLGPVLRLVPIAVLFGVFFYMGVVALHGLQLIERTKLLLTPVKHHPDVRYVTKVRTFKMHLFTIIQLLCLALLGVIKFTKAALAFPFILLLLVPFRLFVLNHIFSESELHELDNEESAAHSEGTPHQVSEASEGSIVEDKLPNSSADDEDQTEIYRPLTTPVM